MGRKVNDDASVDKIFLHLIVIVESYLLRLEDANSFRDCKAIRYSP